MVDDRERRGGGKKKVIDDSVGGGCSGAFCRMQEVGWLRHHVLSIG